MGGTSLLALLWLPPRVLDFILPVVLLSAG